MIKRLCSTALALFLCLTLLPIQALAYLGGIPHSLMNPMKTTIRNEGTIDGSEVYSMTMKGGQLQFYLALDGEHAGQSVTSSVRSGMSYEQSIANGVYEQARFTLQTGKRQKALQLERMEIVDDPSDAGIPVMGDDALTVKCTFSGYGALDPEVACYISYHFVQLGAGTNDGEVPYGAENEEAFAHTYALVAQAMWQTASDNTSEYVFRYYQDYHGFSRMGHGSLSESAAHVKLSRTYETQTGEIVTTAKSTDITTGLGRTTMGQKYGYGSIAEIYSDSYGVDSPFVLADRDRVLRLLDIATPNYMTYDAVEDCLIAEGYTTKLGGPSSMDMAQALHVWGFRDVYTKEEAAASSEVKFTDPDRVTIPQDADKLGFYVSGDTFVVAAITDTARGNVLKKQYGDPLYTLRGDYEKRSDDEGDYYEFVDGLVALTSTITATWSGSSEHFRVRVNDGVLSRFDTTAGVNYSTPGFKLYLPGDNVTDPAPLSFETTTEDGEDDTCLTLQMDPEENDVLVFLDIPEITSKINIAQLRPDGDLILSGEMGLDLILNCSSDKLATLEALGYGAEENEDGSIRFVQNGMKASGNLDTGSLLGLDLAEIEAAINTFEGEEQYDFSLELNAFDLFETAAELSLKRLYNGRLVPNDLYFFLAAEPGIPLVPPVPTSFLKGGGGGFYGLADTINGDYIAIPPMRLKITAKGDYVKVIEGKVNVTLGPSYLEYSGDDVTIAKMDVLDSFNMYLQLVGEKRKYQGTTYTGLRAGGGMGVTIKAPEGDGAIFIVEGNAKASLFGGLNNYTNPTSAYLQIDSRGGITGTVQIPEKFGDTEIPVFGGKKIAEASVEFVLGAQTAVTVDPQSYAGKDAGEVLETAATSAWDNLSVYGGLSTKGSLWGSSYRVYYVIPNHFGLKVGILHNINGNWTLEEEIGKNAWYVGGTKSYALEGASVYSAPLYDEETGDQIGVAVMESSLVDIPADGDASENGVMMLAAMQSNGSYSETVSSPVVTGSESLLLKVFAADDGSAQDLMKGLTITADGTPITLVQPEFNENDELTNADTANCTEMIENGKEGLLIATGLDATNAHSITINAGCNFTTSFVASAALTSLNATFSGTTVNSRIENSRKDTTYAMRYYLDTAQNRSGEYCFLEMNEMGMGATQDTFSVPTDGSLVPSGDYYVTAVLVEKVTGDFNGDGMIAADEVSWVTVDTKTSDTTVHYTNDTTPNAPSSVTLDATGNETLTATWDKVNDADGYRVTLYYQDGTEWKQAGGSYVLDNADFESTSKITAASETANGYSLRMAPTVGGNSVTVSGSETDPTITKSGGTSDAAPADHNYKVTVEAYRNESTGSDADTATNLRYFSAATESGLSYLQAYTVPEITVTSGNGQAVTLNETSGYDTLFWNTLPSDGDMLFTVSGGSSITGITVSSEPGGTALTVSGDSSSGFTVTADGNTAALIEGSGRVRLIVTEGNNVTDYYLRLVLDDTAPILTLDSGNVAADPDTGEYTVSGITEPGLQVSLAIDENDTITTTADANGRFTLHGTLEKISNPDMDETEGYASLLSEVTTQDTSGNTADPAPVVISAYTAQDADPDPDPDPTPREQDPPEGISGGKGMINGTTTAMEYRSTDTEDADWISCKDGSTPADPGNYEVRYAATDDLKASTSVRVTVLSEDEDPDQNKQDPPEGVTGGRGVIEGTTTSMEYRLLGSDDWKTCDDGSTAAEPGNYEIRYAATEDKEASDPVQVTVLGDKKDPDDDSGNRSNGKKTEVKKQEPHHHRYEWRIVREATEDQDGEVNYVCIRCGDVAYGAPRSSFYVYNQNVMNSILNCSKNGTIRVDATKRGWISFSSMFVQALQQRPDVTVTLRYKYGAATYEMTIPAGSYETVQALFDMDGTKDKNGHGLFCGYLNLATKFPAVAVK